jgi:protoheme IX farnesyltransferase
MTMVRTLSREPSVVSSWVLTRKRALDYLALTKARVVLMVLITTFVGFYLASPGTLNWVLLGHTLLGVAFAAGGTLALNQYLERDLDARMLRTRERPLPDGRLQPGEALGFGVAVTVSGLIYLTLIVNPLSGLVTALSVGSYLFLYTPLKQKTSLCVLVGAVPGALPPVTGWVAASGVWSLEAWVLFAILFLWQIPHSLSIAVLYREDYARANFQLLPVLEPEGGSTGRQIVVHSLALLAVGLLPTTIRLAGVVYFGTALILGLMMLVCGLILARSFSPTAARRLLLASLIYLPALLLVMAVDKIRL